HRCAHLPYPPEDRRRSGHAQAYQDRPQQGLPVRRGEARRTVDSIFLRIYGGMLLVLVALLLLAMLVIHQINGNRAVDYRERIASGTFRLIADYLQPMDAFERRQVMNVWQRLLGVPLEMHNLSDLALESAYWSRLLHRAVLVRPTEDGEVRVMAMVDPLQELVLAADIQRVSEQLGR